MTTQASEILDTVSVAGGKIWLDGDKVRASIPPSLTHLVDSLRILKPQLIELLTQRADTLLAAPAPWREPFGRWLSERCISRPGYDDWGGIGCLWVNFCEWAVHHGSVACRRQVFEQLLRDAGFSLKGGLASGLVLKVDLEAIRNWRVL